MAGHPSVQLAMDSGAVTCCSLQPGVAIQESEDLNMLEDWLQLRPLPVSSQKPYMEQILALDLVFLLADEGCYYRSNNN